MTSEDGRGYAIPEVEPHYCAPGRPAEDGCPRCSEPSDTDVLLTKRLTDLVIFAEKAVTALTERIEQADLQLAGRVRERTLLTRAAALIDDDTGALGSVTHEMRLDWLAQYREVTS